MTQQENMDTDTYQDYEAIGDMSWDDVPEPKVLPKGPWVLKGRNAKRMPGRAADGDNKGSAPFVLFFYKAVEPLVEVDDEDLAALGDDYDVAINDLTHRIYIETKADYRKVESFLAKHGVVAEKDESGKKESIDKTLGRFKGAKVIAVLGQRTFTDREGSVRTDNTLTSFLAEQAEE